MSGKCSVCTSEHKGWIEEQHENGKPLRDISKGLEEQFSESISYVAIGNHVNKHMGGESDRTAELEQRIRNLEVWMSSALGPETFLTWIAKIPKPGEVHPQTLSYRNSYMQTIPNPETIEAESIAILSTISGRMDKEEFERDTRQKETWAQEKAERDRLAKKVSDEQEAARKKASEEAKHAEIEEMRKSVKEYDSRPKNK
jgi:hypothetical protein